MIQELDRIILKVDLPEHGLRTGDIGTIALAHTKHEGFEVEFVTLDGETIATISLFTHQIRSIGQREIAQARPLTVA